MLGIRQCADFCCDRIDGKCQLKVDHKFYFRIMGQMAITGVHTYDFIIWTTKDLFMQMINFDSDLCINTCLPKLISSLCSLKSCIPTCLLSMIIHTTSLICIAISFCHYYTKEEWIKCTYKGYLITYMSHIIRNLIKKFKGFNSSYGTFNMYPQVCNPACSSQFSLRKVISSVGCSKLLLSNLASRQW